MPNAKTYLFEVVQGLKQKGHELDDDTLTELAKAMQGPELLQMMQSGEVTSQSLVDQALQGLQAVTQRRQPSQGSQPQLGLPV